MMWMRLAMKKMRLMWWDHRARVLQWWQRWGPSASRGSWCVHAPSSRRHHFYSMVSSSASSSLPLSSTSLICSSSTSWFIVKVKIFWQIQFYVWLDFTYFFLLTEVYVKSSLDCTYMQVPNPMKVIGHCEQYVLYHFLKETVEIRSFEGPMGVNCLLDYA